LFILHCIAWATAGSGYASLVTYLVPPIALAYGAVFLGERFGVTAFAALAIVLAGVALGTGGFRLTRRRSVASEA
jgi:drug/metabolite transporter (DMT)-like permease